MIADLKPYPAMKHSGVEWLGQVPEHWDVKPGRACVYEKRQPNDGMVEDTVLSLSYGRIIVKPKEKLRGLVPESFETYQVVDPRDVICRPTDLQNDRTSLRFGIAKDRGIITSAYMCFGTQEGLDGGFGHLLFHAYDLMKIFYGLGSGLRQNLSWADFKYLPCVTPPLTEQSAIVRYLDHMDRRVSQLVRAKRKLIALLIEQRQAAIDEIMSQDFVRRIPRNILGLPLQVQHPRWRSLSVRHLIQTRKLEIQDGNHGELHPKASDYVEDGIPFLMANNVRPEGLNLEGCAMVAEEQAKSLRIGFAMPGDVLLTHKATIGQVSAVPVNISWPFLMLTPQVTYYRTLTPELSSEFLFWYMRSSLFQVQLRVLSLNQSTRNYIGLLEQRNLVISFPSRVQQENAVLECHQKTYAITEAINTARTEVSLLSEYRNRLIADVVTGKLDVREAVIGLPDIDPVDAEDDLDNVHIEQDSGTTLEEAEV